MVVMEVSWVSEVMEVGWVREVMQEMKVELGKGGNAGNAG